MNNSISKKRYVLFSIKIFIFLAIYLAIGLLFSYISSARSTTQSTYSSNFDIKSAPVIIIDPGHGGVDGGAVSENGIIEKEINLKIAENIRELFSLSGVRCVLTRESDIELKPEKGGSASRKRSDLLARIEIGNSYENAVFISIHQNKYPSSKLSGMQVFYSQNHEDSRVLAQFIKYVNSELLDSKNKRDIKPAGSEIMVLDSLGIPAVLVECGFLSNTAEAKRLSGDEYRQKLALVIYRAVFDYLETKYT